MAIQQPETIFGQTIRSRLPINVYVLKLRVTLMAGIPDLWISGSEQDLWMELKWIPIVPRHLKPSKLVSPLQKKWLLDRHMQGRNVSLLVGSNIGSFFYQGISWMSDPEIERTPIIPTVLKIARFVNGPKTSEDDCRFTRTDKQNALSFLEHSCEVMSDRGEVIKTSKFSL